MSIAIRPATPADAGTWPDLLRRLHPHQPHAQLPARLPRIPGLPSTSSSLPLLAPGFVCLVAETNGRILGSNDLDERSIIYGVGPLTVDPATKTAASDVFSCRPSSIAPPHDAPRVSVSCRPPSTTARSRSTPTLGFDIREPLACMHGRTLARTIPGCTVRPATIRDLPPATRSPSPSTDSTAAPELSHAIARETALLVERAGRITGYATILGFFGHATAETTPTSALSSPPQTPSPAPASSCPHATPRSSAGVSPTDSASSSR